MERGFSLVELLVAAMVSALVVGALLAALAPARAAFDATPATIELQQRSRVGLEFLARAVRSAGVGEPGLRDGSMAGSVVPAVIPAIASGTANVFSDVEVLRQVVPGGRGIVDRDQTAAGAEIALRPGLDCPHTPDVCGFTVGATTAISDGQGRFDIFEVVSTDVSRMSLLPLKPLSAPYGAGARLFEVEAFRYWLATQPDGSKSMVRTARTGAAQPVVDGIADLSISLWGEAAPPQITWDGADGAASYGPLPPSAFRDAGGAWPVGESCFAGRDVAGPWSRLVALGATGTLVRLTRSGLSDGPWCAGGLLGTYDADLIRVRRVDIELRVEALAPGLRGPVGQLFSRPGSSSWSPARWVPDRALAISVSLRDRP
jgi:hypothetical protein